MDEFETMCDRYLYFSRAKMFKSLLREFYILWVVLVRFIRRNLNIFIRVIVGMFWNNWSLINFCVGGLEQFLKRTKNTKYFHMKLLSWLELLNYVLFEVTASNKKWGEIYFHFVQNEELSSTKVASKSALVTSICSLVSLNKCHEKLSVKAS